MDPDFIRGVVRDSSIENGYIFLHFKKSLPRDSIAIPAREFSREILLAVALNDSGGLLKIGSKYQGEFVVAHGKAVKIANGTRIVYVEKLTDVVVRE